MLVAVPRSIAKQVASMVLDGYVRKSCQGATPLPCGQIDRLTDSTHGHDRPGRSVTFAARGSSKACHITHRVKATGPARAARTTRRTGCAPPGRVRPAPSARTVRRWTLRQRSSPVHHGRIGERAPATGTRRTGSPLGRCWPESRRLHAVVEWPHGIRCVPWHVSPDESWSPVSSLGARPERRQLRSRLACPSYAPRRRCLAATIDFKFVIEASALRQTRWHTMRLPDRHPTDEMDRGFIPASEAN